MDPIAKTMIGNVLWNGDQRGWPLEINRAVITDIQGAVTSLASQLSEAKAEVERLRGVLTTADEDLHRTSWSWLEDRTGDKRGRALFNRITNIHARIRLAIRPSADAETPND